jgi:hypothetical protein
MIKIDVKRVITAIGIFIICLFLVSYFTNPSSSEEWGSASVEPSFIAIIYYLLPIIEKQEKTEVYFIDKDGNKIPEKKRE